MSRAGKDHSCLLTTAPCEAPVQQCFPFCFLSSFFPPLCSNRGELNKVISVVSLPRQCFSQHSLRSWQCSANFNQTSNTAVCWGWLGGEEDPPLPPKTGALLFSQQFPTQEAVPRALQVLLGAELELHPCFATSAVTSCSTQGSSRGHQLSLPSLR